ncbi:MAG: family 43 glycosylhydrolase [Clostridia bacterium]|nr:family 43 glycosylhydrolase [Clostridia bacterium]
MKAINPVLYSDFPDPDVIRVGETYYLVTTTMHFFPGAQILSSRDLVNWQHEAYAYDIFGETEKQQLKNGGIYGQGMWAPCLRYHDGVFHLVFCCNDTRRCYHYTASDIRGPWEKRYIEGFYHDPSVLFDDDGRVYIVYGNRDIYITQLKEDLSAPMPGGLHRQILHDETEGLGWEGSHIYKIQGKYYLCNIHWPKGHMRTQGLHMAESLTGDFIGGDVLEDDLDGSFRGVAQGGLIDTPDGEWYMMLFQDHGAEGRMPVLVSVKWQGNRPVPQKGQAILETDVDETLPKLYTSDALRGGISPLWQWNHEPDGQHMAFSDNGLQLTCIGPAENVEQARNTLTQKCFGRQCICTVTLDVSGLKEGDYAGICALQGCFGQLCITVKNEQKILSLITREAAENSIFKSPEQPQERVSIPLTQDIVTLRAAFDYTCDQVQFFYDRGGIFVPVGNAHPLTYRLDHFTGCRIGLCAFSQAETGGKVLFRDFVYQVLS